MSGTSASSQLQELVRDSLFETGAVYVRLDNDELRYDGERPGEGWHAHGYFSCTVVMLQGGVPGARVLWKRRWIITDDGGRHTCHSRPPDVLPRVRFCLLFVVCGRGSTRSRGSTTTRRSSTSWMMWAAVVAPSAGYDGWCPKGWSFNRQCAWR